MDETEYFPLAFLPPRALSVRLARSAIKMQHAPRWRIDKLNPVHDLVVPLTGRGLYRIEDEEITLEPGEALLIPAFNRFRGRHGGGPDHYTGVAQHFSLDLFDRGDAIREMHLRRKVRLTHWDSLAPLVRLYRETTPRGATTLPQQHQFMVILLAFLEDAFLGWKAQSASPEAQDQLSLHIMFVAAHLSADPLGSVVDEALAGVPYNADYFRRAFRDRLGATPRKFRELKRMEFAIHRLESGRSVKEVAAELGFSDPYFFSRLFKRHIGASPSDYRARRDRPVEPSSADHLPVDR